jgi:hypothetical protein
MDINLVLNENVILDATSFMLVSCLAHSCTLLITATSFTEMSVDFQRV